MNSAQRHIYQNLVLRTARLELGDDEELNKEPHEYPFDYGYELFAAGLVIGFLHKDNREESKGSYSQDFTEVDDVSSDEHRATIEFIWELIQLEEDKSGSDAWELARQYADAGVNQINHKMDIKDEFDLLGFMNTAENQWEDRIEEITDSIETEEEASAD